MITILHHNILNQNGGCSDCFNSISEWELIFNEMKFNILYKISIPRFEFPFSVTPFFYPVPRTMFVLQK